MGLDLWTQRGQRVVLFGWMSWEGEPAQPVRNRVDYSVKGGLVRSSLSIMDQFEFCLLRCHRNK